MSKEQEQNLTLADSKILETAKSVIKIYKFQPREIIRYCDTLNRVRQSMTFLCHDMNTEICSRGETSTSEEEAYIFAFNAVLPIIVGEKIYNSVTYHQIIAEEDIDEEIKKNFIEKRLAPYFEREGLSKDKDTSFAEKVYEEFFPFPETAKSPYKATADLRNNLMLALSGLRVGHDYGGAKKISIGKHDYYILDTGIQIDTDIQKTEDGAGKVMTLTLGDGVKLEMVYCPAGTFTMGSPKAELGRFKNEEPHEVTLTESFWIGKYPVTQAQYKAIAGENPSHFKGDTRPVEQVSWSDSVAFCEILNELRIAPAGYKFALPTEAQWEYACRAGRATALNNGKPITSEDGKCPNLDKVGWYDENSGAQTHPVGEKKANAWGIYDMHGNVWEWCMDCSNMERMDGVWLTETDTYKDGIVDPLCKTGGDRVLRGGSWDSDAGYCRSAYRLNFVPDNRDISYGFRLALVPEQKTASPRNRRSQAKGTGAAPKASERKPRSQRAAKSLPSQPHSRAQRSEF